MKAFALSIIVCCIAGCANPFAPKLETGQDASQSILGDQHSIDGVLQNFKQAYLFRDTTIYGHLLAPDFIFVYRDYDKGVDVFWGRDDEMQTTYGLFQNVQRLDLVWNSAVVQTGDSLRATVTRNFNLTVTFSANDVVRVDGYANLTIERQQPADVWRITRWRDESNF